MLVPEQREILKRLKAEAAQRAKSVGQPQAAPPQAAPDATPATTATTPRTTAPKRPAAGSN